MTVIDFLHSTGKFARISSMLSKERSVASSSVLLTLRLFSSVKSRMGTSSGISFAEFSYQLLQAHDFWHLYKNYNCSTQVGGSDQWGNILAGLDMIARLETNPKSMGRGLGITTPLLTTSSGQKFGKSAGNAIWLNHQKTSVFDFYQASNHLSPYLLLM
jgi:tyrosyl-tRNA synthetase